MIFNFFDFSLNTKKQTLFHGDIEIDITKINYQVLLFFIEHRSEVVTKDQIIEAVWHGKLVTDNSIDQSISKIRKSLAQYDNRIIIKTAYGKGLEFIPEVSTVADESKPPLSNKTGDSRKWLVTTLLMGFAAIVLWQFSAHFINQPKANHLPPIMWVKDTDNDDWLNQSSHQLLNQVFTNSGQNYLLDSESKPNQLSNQEYIDNYWRINPELEVIKTTLEQQSDIYTLNIEVATQASAITESFSGADLLKLLTQSNQWLVDNSGLSAQQSSSHSLLPQDPHVLELHLRSLHAYTEGELDQALNYIQLVIDQEPSFDLAWLQLAQVQYVQGKSDESLATLDRLNKLTFYPQFEISAQSLRGEILDTAGNYEEAIDTYQQLLLKYPHEAQGKLLPVKFNLSYSLTSIQRYDEALSELDEIITALNDQFDLDLVAHAWHKKGSILLQIGQTPAAKEAANIAYQHFNDLSDLMSTGKVNILLARIANHESNYQQAADYLQQSIGIYRHAEFPLGVGATLNELIYILMVNGQFSLAWTHMLEMRQIALDIDYFAMLMAAKEFEVEISRYRKQWVQAEASLADYFRLATDNEFIRGLSKHRLFELDLALDQGQVERAIPLIESIQQHIEVSGEERLQPRLNIQQAKVYFLQDQADSAIELLNKTKAMALLTEDMESIHKINNELLQHYLNVEDFISAQTIVSTVDQSITQPVAYPFLLLKSKTHLGLGDTAQAIKWAVQCKSQAHEFWRSADEQYLATLEPN